MRTDIETIPQDLFVLLDEIYDEKLNLGLEINLQVPTDSMYPIIKPGQNIRIKKMSNYKKNDVVLFCEKNFYIVHRIVKVENDFVVTKGDNNQFNDKRISTNKIRGKVIGLVGSKLTFDQEYKKYFNKINFIKRRAYIKLKNFCFKYHDLFILKLFLHIFYRLNILLVKMIFLFTKATVFIRGSYIQGNLVPGLSDLDFIIVSNQEIDYKVLLKKIKFLEKLSPILSFNSLLDIELYKLFYKNGFVGSIYDSFNYKKISGPNIIFEDKENCYKRIELQEKNEFLYYVSNLLIKFSQLKSHHPSYVYHNIKKIFKSLYSFVDLDKEKNLLDKYLYIDRSKTIRKDTALYARYLFNILKKYDERLDPKYNFELEKYPLMETIRGKDYYLFDRLERLEAFVLHNDYTETDIKEFIDYFSDEHIQVFSTGVISQKMVKCLSILNIESLLTLEEKVFDEDIKYAILRNGFLFNKYFSLETESVDYFKYLYESNLRFYVLLKFGEKTTNKTSAVKVLRSHDSALANEVDNSMKVSKDLGVYEYFNYVRPIFNKLIKNV